MKIITLGSCCKKSVQNHQNAVIAAKNCGIEEPVNVSDINEEFEHIINSIHRKITALKAKFRKQ